MTHLSIPWEGWWQTERRKEVVPEEEDTTYTVMGCKVTGTFPVI